MRSCSPPPTWLGTGHSSVGDQEKAREILGVPGRPRRRLLIGGSTRRPPANPSVKPNRLPSKR